MIEGLDEQYFMVEAPFWTNLKELTDMTTLQVTGMGLSHAASDGLLNPLICELTQLTELNLAQNAIQIVDAKIAELTELVSLDLSQNALGVGNTQSGGVPGLPA